MLSFAHIKKMHTESTMESEIFYNRMIKVMKVLSTYHTVTGEIMTL